MKRIAVDRGEATAQAVIAVPVVLMVLWLAIQATVFIHGANVADAAANEGAAAAARYGSSSKVGGRVIGHVLSDLGVTRGANWNVSHSGSEVVARVTVDLPRIAPFFPTSVTRSAHEPIERFLTESQR
jgi:TadE-like protein